MRKTKKKQTFRFRCETELLVRFQKIARGRHRNPSTLARELIWDYVEREESKK